MGMVSWKVTEVQSVGVVSWVVTWVWTIVLVNRGVVNGVVIGYGQWLRSVGGSVEGPDGVVNGGGQWHVVSWCGQWMHSVDVFIGMVSGCDHSVWSVDVVSEKVVSWCDHWVWSVGVWAVGWSVSLLC